MNGSLSNRHRLSPGLIMFINMRNAKIVPNLYGEDSDTAMEFFHFCKIAG